MRRVLLGYLGTKTADLAQENSSTACRKGQSGCCCCCYGSLMRSMSSCSLLFSSVVAPREPMADAMQNFRVVCRVSHVTQLSLIFVKRGRACGWVGVGVVVRTNLGTVQQREARKRYTFMRELTQAAAYTAIIPCKSACRIRYR